MKVISNRQAVLDFVRARPLTVEEIIATFASLNVTVDLVDVEEELLYWEEQGEMGFLPDDGKWHAVIHDPMQKWVEDNRDLLERCPDDFFAVDVVTGRVMMQDHNEDRFEAWLESYDGSNELYTFHAELYVRGPAIPVLVKPWNIYKVGVYKETSAALFIVTVLARDEEEAEQVAFSDDVTVGLVDSVEFVELVCSADEPCALHIEHSMRKEFRR